MNTVSGEASITMLLSIVTIFFHPLSR